MENNNNNNFGLICAIILGISLFFSSVGCSILSESLITGVYCEISPIIDSNVGDGYDYTMFGGSLYPFFVNEETGEGWYFSGSQPPAVWHRSWTPLSRQLFSNMYGVDPYWDTTGFVINVRAIAESEGRELTDPIYNILELENFSILLNGEATFMFYYNPSNNSLKILDNGAGGTAHYEIDMNDFYTPMKHCLDNTVDFATTSYPITLFFNEGFRFYNYVYMSGDYKGKSAYSVSRKLFNDNHYYTPDSCLGDCYILDYHGFEYNNYLGTFNPEFKCNFSVTPDGSGGYSGLTLRYNADSFVGTSFSNLYCYFDYRTYSFDSEGVIDYPNSNFARIYVPFSELLKYKDNSAAGVYDYALRIPFDDILTAFGRHTASSYIRCQGVGFFFADFNPCRGFYDTPNSSTDGSAGGEYLPSDDSFIGKFPLDASSYCVSGSNYYAFHYDDEVSLEIATTITKRRISFNSSSCLSSQEEELLDEDGNVIDYSDTLNTLINSTNSIIGNDRTFIMNFNNFFRDTEIFDALNSLFESIPELVLYLLEFSFITVLLIIAFRKFGG